MRSCKFEHSYHYFHCLYKYIMGRDSSIGIATRYGLGCPGIESRWGRDFPLPSTAALQPIQPLVQWVLSHFRGKTAGSWRWPPTPYSSEVPLLPLGVFLACYRVNFTTNSYIINCNFGVLKLSIYYLHYIRVYFHLLERVSLIITFTGWWRQRVSLKRWNHHVNSPEDILWTTISMKASSIIQYACLLDSSAYNHRDCVKVLPHVAKCLCLRNDKRNQFTKKTVTVKQSHARELLIWCKFQWRMKPYIFWE